MIELNKYYQDRGIQKYNGFYLSEHTAKINETAMERNLFFKGEDEMEQEEIYQVIDIALYKNQRVSVQLNLRDNEGSFLEPVNGKIQGYDEEGLYIDEVKIPLNQIRHIEIVNQEKWYH